MTRATRWCSGQHCHLEIFLFEVCMFSVCLCGFSLNSPALSHSPKQACEIKQDPKLHANVNCLSQWASDELVTLCQPAFTLGQLAQTPECSKKWLLKIDG